MNKQPETLRLANELDWLSQPAAWDAAAELRRLHAENEKLRAAMEQQEPVAWLHTDRLGGKQAFTNEPPPGLKALCQPLVYATQEKEEQEPLFWYRPRSDGLYEGPLHKSQIERVRKESGGWVPLYTK